MNKLQVEQEIVRIISKITGIENSNVRISYQTTGMPFIEAHTDYCFISLNYFDSVFTRPIEIEFNANEEVETYKGTRGIVANLTFYGDNAFDNASKVRVMTKDSSVLKNLRREMIYLINDTAEPRRLPVMYNQQWYEQVYLDLRFYQKLLYNTNRHYINSVEIKLISDHKEQDFIIEEE